MSHCSYHIQNIQNFTVSSGKVHTFRTAKIMLNNYRKISINYWFLSQLWAFFLQNKIPLCNSLNCRRQLLLCYRTPKNGYLLPNQSYSWYLFLNNNNNETTASSAKEHDNGSCNDSYETTASRAHCSLKWQPWNYRLLSKT